MIERKSSTYGVYCGVIWSNGLSQLSEILDVISANNLEIIYVEKLNFDNIDDAISLIYRIDYAPWEHIRGKSEYLSTLANEIAVVFVKVESPTVVLMGEGRFLHNECLEIREVKNILRNLFNAKNEDLTISQDHVVHFSDTEAQALMLAQNFSDKLTTNLFLYRNMTDYLSRPYFAGSQRYKLIEVALDDLYARICSKDWQEKTVHHITKIEKTPHFLFCLGNTLPYRNYLREFLGITILEYRSLKKYRKYLEIWSADESLISEIIVEKVEDKYVISDGLHRAAYLNSRRHSNQTLKALLVVGD